MALFEETMAKLAPHFQKRGDQSEIGAAAGVPQSALSNAFGKHKDGTERKKKSQFLFENACKLLEYFGAKIVFPGEVSQECEKCSKNRALPKEVEQIVGTAADQSELGVPVVDVLKTIALNAGSAAKKIEAQTGKPPSPNGRDEAAA